MRLALVSCVLAAAACGGGTATMAERAQAANADGKVLVVEFYTDWCQVCRTFESEVVPDPQVQRALGDVRFVRLDAERGRGKAEARRLGVRAYPTFFVIGRDGRPLSKARGLPTIEYFVGFLEWGLVYSLDERHVKRRLETDRSARGLLVAARWAAHNQHKQRALAFYDKALAAPPDDSVPRAQLVWERSQVEHAGASAQAWAQSAAAFVAAHPDYPRIIDPLRIALLSGGLDEAERRVAAEAYIELASAVALDDAIYVLVAADMNDLAMRAAGRLVSIAPGVPRYEDTLAVASGEAQARRRIAGHRAWTRRRMLDLGIAP